MTMKKTSWKIDPGSKNFGLSLKSKEISCLSDLYRHQRNPSVNPIESERTTVVLFLEVIICRPLSMAQESMKI